MCAAVSVPGGHKKISDRAVRVIGEEIILTMSPPQRGLFNKALDRLVERAGSTLKVPDAERERQYN